MASLYWVRMFLWVTHFFFLFSLFTRNRWISSAWRNTSMEYWCAIAHTYVRVLWCATSALLLVHTYSWKAYNFSEAKNKQNWRKKFLFLVRWRYSWIAAYRNRIVPTIVNKFYTTLHSVTYVVDDSSISCVKSNFKRKPIAKNEVLFITP